LSILDSRITRRQLLAATAAALPAAALFAACGSSGSTATKGGKPSSLTFSNWWGDQFANYLPLMQKLTDIKVNQQLYAYSSTKFFTPLASGTAPDMFLFDSAWNGTILPEASKYLVAFDERLKTKKVDMSKWDVPPSTEEGYGGKTWGLSLFVAQDVICFVNKEAADQDGLLKELPVWGTPAFDTWKWDKYVDWLKAGTKVTSSGKVEQYGLSLGTNPGGLLFSAMLASFGGALVNNLWTYDETKSLFNTEPVVETVQNIADLYTKHKCVAPLGVETAITGGTYLAKRSLSTVGNSTPSEFPVSQNFPMEYFHLPFQEHRVHCHGANALGVNQHYSDPDPVLDWIITFATNTEVRKKFLEVSSVPAYDPLTIVEASAVGDPKTIALINLSRIKGKSSIPNDTAGVIGYPYWVGGRYAPADTAAAVSSVVESVILGKSTAQAACATAAKQLDAKIADGRRAAGK
jgi:ABC-type glycerol-3-phosphate transport system substrate-binding protein